MRESTKPAAREESDRPQAAEAYAARAYERLLKSDVKYRFSIDMASFKSK